MAMSGLFGAVIALVILGFLGWMAWISVQSLLQGRVLLRALALPQLKDNLDRVVSVHGTPEPAGPSYGPMGFPVLWYRKKYQEYHRSGKSGSWRTIDSEERTNEFFLNFPDGGRVRVLDKPTEIQGIQRRTDKASMWSNQRTVFEWLPISPGLTVMGKLALSATGATLTPDAKLGFLFSTYTPKGAAAIEIAKGIVGLLLVLGGLVFGLILAFSADFG
jgi:hypothetical protein